MSHVPVMAHKLFQLYQHFYFSLLDEKEIEFRTIIKSFNAKVLHAFVVK